MNSKIFSEVFWENVIYIKSHKKAGLQSQSLEEIFLE